MTKEIRGEPSAWGRIAAELLKTGVYKRSQGRLVRQFTCLAIWLVVALGAYRTWEYLRVVPLNLPAVINKSLPVGVQEAMPTVFLYLIPSLMLVVGLWIGYRLVNLPSFADFLIAVEAEMNKVSWPSRIELTRASMVVIILMFGLTIVLYFYDVALYWFFSKVLRIVE